MQRGNVELVDYVYLAILSHKLLSSLFSQSSFIQNEDMFI